MEKVRNNNNQKNFLIIGPNISLLEEYKQLATENGAQFYETNNDDEYKTLQEKLTTYNTQNKSQKIKVIISAHGFIYDDDESGSLNLGKTREEDKSIPNNMYPGELLEDFFGKDIKKNDNKIILDVYGCYVGGGIESKNRYNEEKWFKDKMPPGTSIILNSGKQTLQSAYIFYLIKNVLKDNTNTTFESFLNAIILSPNTTKLAIINSSGEFNSYKFSMLKPKSADDVNNENIKKYLKSEIDRFCNWWIDNKIDLDDSEINPESINNLKEKYKTELTSDHINRYRNLALILESYRGKAEYVKHYTQNNNIDPNYNLFESSSILFIAIEQAKSNQDYEQVALNLIDCEKLDINQKRYGGDTLLHVAIKNSNLNIISSLIAKPQIQIDKENKEGDSALHLALKKGSVEIVKKLLEAGANPNKKRADGFSPMRIAFESNNPKIISNLVNALLDAGADINQTLDNNNTTLLHYLVNLAVQKAKGLGSTDIIKIIDDLLVKRKEIKIDQETKDGAAPLFTAILNQQNELAKTLILRGANINKLRNSDGLTYLLYAVDNNDLEMVDNLLLLNANPNAVDREFKGTPLFLAAQNGNIAIVNRLLKVKKGIDINKGLEEYGTSPLYIAIQEGHEEIVELLLKQKGIDVNQPLIKDGNNIPQNTTPLYIAAKLGYTNIVKDLLKAGADPFILTATGKSSLDVAQNSEIKQLLVEVLEKNAPHESFETITEEKYRKQLEVKEEIILKRNNKKDYGPEPIIIKSSSKLKNNQTDKSK